MKTFHELCTDVKVIDSITIADKVLKKVRILPNAEVIELPRHEALIVTCAAYDPVEGIVYVDRSRIHRHSYLVESFDLESTSNQKRLNEIIYGFVISGGIFVNRMQASILMCKHWELAIKRDARYHDEYFNSEDLNWHILEEMLNDCEEEIKQAG